MDRSLTCTNDPATVVRPVFSSSTSPPQAHSITSDTMLLHDPQPMPARVASITAFGERLPFFTHATRAPLLTPLQLQTCVSGGISSMDICFEGAPISNKSANRSSGKGVLRSKACVR